jgi:hypothetical protein
MHNREVPPRRAVASCAVIAADPRDSDIDSDIAPGCLYPAAGALLRRKVLRRPARVASH